MGTLNINSDDPWNFNFISPRILQLLRWTLEFYLFDLWNLHISFMTFDSIFVKPKLKTFNLWNQNVFLRNDNLFEFLFKFTQFNHQFNLNLMPFWCHQNVISSFHIVIVISFHLVWCSYMTTLILFQELNSHSTKIHCYHIDCMSESVIKCIEWGDRCHQNNNSLHSSNSNAVQSIVSI